MCVITKYSLFPLSVRHSILYQFVSRSGSVQQVPLSPSVTAVTPNVHLPLHTHQVQKS